MGVASGFFARTERTTSHRRQPVPAWLAIARSSLVPVPDKKLRVTLGSAAVVVFPAPSDTFRPLRYFRAPRHICRISRRSRHRTPALLGVTT